MNDIEREIEEIEELIRLQRLKCDLLHRKNSATFLSDAKTEKKAFTLDETAKDEKDDDSTKDKKDEDNNTTMNVLHQRSKSKEVALRLTDNVRSLMMSTTTFKDDKASMSVMKEDELEKEDSKTDSKLIKPDPPAETREDRFVNAITRLSRLNTDLANERNLLAWARTALASARTFLAFIGVSAVTDFGRASRQVCYLGFAIMSIYIILQGTERYNKIKRIVYLKNPPPNFDRLTNAPLPICLAILFLLGLASITFDQWED